MEDECSGFNYGDFEEHIMNNGDGNDDGDESNFGTEDGKGARMTSTMTTMEVSHHLCVTTLARLRYPYGTCRGLASFGHFCRGESSPTI